MKAPASAVVDGDGQYSLAEMTVNESEESRQQLPLLVRRGCMDFSKDDLAQATLDIRPG
jgi:hypothetical protein